MIGLAIYEARLLGRRGSFAAALAVHALAASLFVMLWMPTGGVPLWEASLLQQLAAADRVLTGALLTWLSTFVFADDEGGMRNAIDWSALTGRSVRSVFRTRIAAMAAMSVVLVAVAVPAFVAAADASAAPINELAGHLGAALGFACFCLGVTSMIAATVRDRVAVWCIAMAVCLAAAVGVRALETAALRALVPALAGAAMLALAPSAVRSSRHADGG
jgi:hypothetical protein